MELLERIGAYRIEGLLGRGGMGAVYRAYDERLGRTVAIKQIRAAELAEPEMVQRFLREARSTAELRHPAIVQTLHMLEEDGHDYIVMEYVEGRTLAQVLHENGPLSPSRAVSLLRQIALGLAAAHSRGIIHRDIKTKNLMVTPEDHARILDFGLAKRLGSQDASISEAGKILGTPSTMSPEQARGEAVDHRSDLFSLGAVFYEVLTGKAPFKAENVTATLVKVCMEHPEPPAELDPTIPQDLSNLIVWLLQKEPDDRPKGAADVVSELELDESAVSTLNVSPPRPIQEPGSSSGLAVEGGANADSMERISPRQRWRLVSASAAALLLGGIFWGVWQLGFLRGQGSEPRPDSPPSAVMPRATLERPSVAVLGLENLSGEAEDDWLATAISEVMITELGAGGAIRVIGGSEVLRATQKLANNPLTELSPQDLSRINEVLGVTTFVWGAYSDLDDQSEALVRIDLRLQDVNGQILASKGSTGTTLQLVSLISRTVNEFRRQVGVGDLTAAEELESEAAFPSGVDAFRLYSEGLTNLRQLNYFAALESLRAAVEVESHAMLFAALAEAWTALGYSKEAREAAEQAEQLAARLPKRLQREIEARHFAATLDWNGAAQIYQDLFTTFPDDIDLGLKLADAQTKAGQLPGAWVTLEALSQMPTPLGLDPRIDLAKAEASYVQGEAEKMLEFADQAIAQGQALDLPLVVALAKLRQTTAYMLLGEHSRVPRGLQETKELFEIHRGDRQAYAKALELMANSVLNRGDLAGARPLFNEALEVYQAIGNRRRAASVQGSIAQVSLNEGRLQDAERLLEEALAASRELDDKKEQAILLNNLGSCQVLQGRWSPAADSYSRALALSEELRDTSGIAFATTNLAEILYIQGDLDQARTMHHEALRINRVIPDPYGIAYDTFRLGKILAAKGDLFAAREKYSEALEIQTDLREAAAAAETRLEQAILELIDGDPRNAEMLSRQAEEVLRNEGWSDLALRAGAVQARALFAIGQRVAAEALVAKLEKGAKSQDLRARVAVAIVSSQVRTQNKAQAEGFAEEIFDIAEYAAQAGYLEQSFEARLAAGHLQLYFGVEGATENLAALESEAREQGYVQIARRASPGVQPSLFGAEDSP